MQQQPQPPQPPTMTDAQAERIAAAIVAYIEGDKRRVAALKEQQ